MDQSRDTLKEAYKSVILSAGFGDKDFKTKCLQFLEKCEVKSCFKLLPFKDIQKEFCGKLTVTEDAKYHHLCKVFQQFEKYAASLVAKPWCKDLYTIKVYTGFFKYNFERWISTDTVYRVFELIGYKSTSADTLTLEPPPNEDRVLVLGLELCLAHTQLYRLKTTGFLNAEYLMKDVIEGWVNTTGNTVEIRDWLVENKHIANESPQFQELDLSNTDIPDQTARPASVTIDEKPMYFDKNGHCIRNEVRYPPNDSTGVEYNEALQFLDKTQGSRIYQDARSDDANNFPSIVSTDYSDFDLYGDSENSTSTAPSSRVPSDYLKATAPLSLPCKSSNGNYKNHCDENGDYVRLSALNSQGNHIRSCQYKHNLQDEARPKDWLSSNAGENVVARGGNLEPVYSRSATPDSSSIHGNIVSREMGDHIYPWLENITRVENIMANRIKSGEKRVAGKLSHDGFIINGDKISPTVAAAAASSREIVKESFNDKVVGENKRSIDEQHSTKHQLVSHFSTISNQFSETMLGIECPICNNLATLGCGKCGDVVCNDCVGTHMKQHAAYASTECERKDDDQEVFV